jgi:hypothetical protein
LPRVGSPGIRTHIHTTEAIVMGAAETVGRQPLTEVVCTGGIDP